MSAVDSLCLYCLKAVNAQDKAWDYTCFRETRAVLRGDRAHKLEQSVTEEAQEPHFNNSLENKDKMEGDLFK